MNEEEGKEGKGGEGAGAPHMTFWTTPLV